MAKINIITLGESGVGKTSLSQRFTTGKFKKYTRSTFIDYFPKTITVEGNAIDITVWDTAGQERYRSLIKRYYALADGVLLVYDVNDAVTFSELSGWLTILRSENETAEVLLVGNKNEDPSRRQVSNADIRMFAEAHHLQHLEVSAKTGENVDSIFYHLAKQVLLSKGVLTQLESSIDTSQSKNSQQFREKEEEPEISFTYYKRPTTPEEKRPANDALVLAGTDPEETSKRKDCSC